MADPKLDGPLDRREAGAEFLAHLGHEGMVELPPPVEPLLRLH
ncbi:MAG TPA: hypothetical protein VIM34_21695 [Burkholderiaceae bacterium]